MHRSQKAEKEEFVNRYNVQCNKPKKHIPCFYERRMQTPEMPPKKCSPRHFESQLLHWFPQRRNLQGQKWVVSRIKKGADDVRVEGMPKETLRAGEEEMGAEIST